MVKAHDLLTRQGVVVPQRTLHRYALDVLEVGRSARTTTVRVADGEPGGELVRVFWSRPGGQGFHRRHRPGGRADHTDPADLTSERTVYALRDIDHLKRLAASHGDAIGVFAAAILDHPLPWTRMRQVYALLGLVKKWGPK